MHLPLLSAIGVLIYAAPSLAVAQTASRTLSCGNIPTPSPIRRPQFHCDSQGTVLPGSSHVIKSFASDTGDDQACYQGCLGDVNCISFSYETKRKRCVSYSSTVNSLGFTRSNTSGAFYTNLKGCFLPATCQPAPKQYMVNGGFENATLDSHGYYQVANWYPEDLADIQKADGYGHSSFSLLMVNVSTTVYDFPEPLIGGNNYEFSFYYHIAQRNGVTGTYVQYKFGNGQYLGGFNLPGGPGSYTRANVTFTYNGDDGGQTELIFFMVGIHDSDTQGQEVVVFDDFSVIDAPSRSA